MLSIGSPQIKLLEKLEKTLREGLEGWLAEHQFPTTGKVRGRLLYPPGVFLSFSTAVLYFPYTGEGQHGFVDRI